MSRFTQRVASDRTAKEWSEWRMWHGANAVRSRRKLIAALAEHVREMDYEFDALERRSTPDSEIIASVLGELDSYYAEEVVDYLQDVSVQAEAQA